MTYNDSSKIYHNPIKISFWNLFEFFRKHSSCKMDKTGHATILRNPWFCKQYAQYSKQAKLQLSLHNNHNIKSQTEKLTSLPILSYMLLVVIINTYNKFKINTHSWKLSVDKHATNYTYKKLQITQATMKWSLQTKVQHKTAAHTNVTLM